MKYISLIDEFDITPYAILHLDTAQKSHLQKQLEAKDVLYDKGRLEILSTCVNALESREVREAHFFIESHPWLKKTILEKHHELDIKSFDSTFDPRKIAPYTKTFTTPFLIQIVPTTLSYLLSKEKYHLFIRFVSQERYFSEDVRQIIIHFFSTTLKEASNYIIQGKVKESSLPVAFLKNADFIKSINIYISELTNELIGINSAIIRLYNLNQQAANSEWNFATSIMVAFEKLLPTDTHLRDVFIRNASMAKSSKFKSDLLELGGNNTQNSTKKTSPFTFISIAASIIIIIGIVLGISYSNFNYDDPIEDIEIINSEETNTSNQQAQNDSENNTDKSFINEETETKKPTIETSDAEETRISEYTTLPNQSKRYTQDNHIRFLYSLNSKVTKGDHEVTSRITKITPFTNPYPKTFNTIKTDTPSSSSLLEINNDTQKELIIFKLQDGVDEAIIIPKDDKAVLNFKQGDSIAFYAGSDFSTSRFSHFTKQQDLSNIYEVTSISAFSKIKVFPFKDNSGSAKNQKFHRSVEVLEFTNFKAKKLQSIAALYTDYYNSYYKR